MNLEPLLNCVGEQVTATWYDIAKERYPLIPDRWPVWGRFASWLLRTMVRRLDGEPKVVTEQVCELFRRKLVAESLTEDEWFQVADAMNDVVRTSSHPMVWVASEVIATECVALYRPEEAPAAAAHVVTEWAVASEQTNAWELLSLMLLLHLQLQTPPRDPTEAALQRSILDDPHSLPIYCDYLEEQGDAISDWLRRL